MIHPTPLPIVKPFPPKRVQPVQVPVAVEHVLRMAKLVSEHMTSADRALLYRTVAERCAGQVPADVPSKP